MFPSLQGNPLPKNKPLGFGILFFGMGPNSGQKQTKNIVVFYIDSPKLGGGAPTASKFGGKVTPPPPPVPAYLQI